MQLKSESETLQMRQRLLVNPDDADALSFFSVLDEWKSKRKKA